MWWMILVVVAYIPIFYRIHRRINELEAEVERLKEEA